MTVQAGMGEWLHPSNKVCIELVDITQLNKRWRQCYEYFDNNRKYWEHYYALEDLYIEVFSGAVQLWLVGDEEGHWGCFLTKILEYPKAKVFQIMFAAANTDDGIDKLEAGETYHEYMIAWAKRLGCTYSEIGFGRLGWKRVGERLGYECIRVSMRKSLEHIWRH